MGLNKYLYRSSLILLSLYLSTTLAFGMEEERDENPLPLNTTAPRVLVTLPQEVLIVCPMTLATKN